MKKYWKKAVSIMLSGALILSMGSMSVWASSSDESVGNPTGEVTQDGDESVTDQEEQKTEEKTEDKTQKNKQDQKEEQKEQLTANDKKPEKKEQENLSAGSDVVRGGLKITGGEENKDFSFDNGIITVLNSNPLEFTNENTAETAVSIEPNVGVTEVNLTLNNVNIKITDKPALNMGTAAATITLKGTNKIVTEGVGAALLTEKSLIIKGEGDLSATGDTDYPGIGVTENGQVLFQGTGIVRGIGKGIAAGIGGGKNITPKEGSIQIVSGNVQGTGGTDAQPIGRAKGDVKINITGTSNTIPVYQTVIKGLEKDMVYSDVAVKMDDKDYSYGTALKADDQGSVTLYLPAGEASVTVGDKAYTGTIKDETDAENSLTYEAPAPETLKDISKVAITGITAPATGKEPDTSGKETSDEYSINKVTWSPEAGDAFKEKVRYRATVTATAEEGYQFTNSTTGTIDGKKADVDLQDGKLKISYTFPATKETVIHNPVTADAGNNRIAGIKPSTEVSYRAGAALKFQAIGDGSQPDDEQTLTPGEGDQRYVPVNWICGNENGSWKNPNEAGDYVGTINTSTTPGEHTLTVYFVREVYSEEGEWEQEENKASVKLTFKTAKTGSGASGSSKTSGGTSKNTSSTSKSSNAKTGDTSPIGSLTFLAAAGAGCAAMIYMKKKREEDQEEE